jgi:hypothetical protein
LGELVLPVHQNARSPEVKVPEGPAIISVSGTAIAGKTNNEERHKMPNIRIIHEKTRGFRDAKKAEASWREVLINAGTRRNELFSHLRVTMGKEFPISFCSSPAESFKA